MLLYLSRNKNKPNASIKISGANKTIPQTTNTEKAISLTCILSIIFKRLPIFYFFYLEKYSTKDNLFQILT